MCLRFTYQSTANPFHCPPTHHEAGHVGVNEVSQLEDGVPEVGRLGAANGDGYQVHQHNTKIIVGVSWGRKGGENTLGGEFLI